MRPGPTSHGAIVGKDLQRAPHHRYVVVNHNQQGIIRINLFRQRHRRLFQAYAKRRGRHTGSCDCSDGVLA